MFFYFKKESKSIFIFLIISGVLSSLGYLLYSQADFPFESFHWSLVKHFFSFTFGVFIYIVFRSKWNYFAGYSNSSLPAILLFLSFIAYIIAGFTYRDLATTLFVGFMILICKARSSVSRVVFENQLILFVGNISYSVYLVHMLFFHHLSRQFKVFDNPFVVLAATLGLSSLTYYFIEKPFINLGKKITIA